VYRLVFHQRRGHLLFFLDGARLYDGPVVAGYDRRRSGYGEPDSGLGPQARIGVYRVRNDVETSVVEFRNVDIKLERDGSLLDRVATPLAY
jgi:hypothetical protein